MAAMEVEVAANGAAQSPERPATPVPPAPRRSDPALDSLKYEYQLVKAPLEYLKKTVRAGGRAAEKDLNGVLLSVAECAKREITEAEAVRQLDSWMAKLQSLKRKMEDSSRAERGQAQRCRARVAHLALLGEGGRESQAQWARTRVDRLLVDYMLRSSFHSSAERLAVAAGVQELADIELFEEARRVVEALRGHRCSEALAWCKENKAKLARNESKLEFHLRIQEFIELVRGDCKVEAVAYARRHLSTWGGGAHLKELQQAMATLAFGSQTECTPYRRFYDEGQWEKLVQLFERDFYALYGLTSESLLQIYLQAGLSALKEPLSEDDGGTREDPLTLLLFRQLAAPLPYAKHVLSSLVCRMSHAVMDEHNPPLVLPNGYVYSKKALEEMAAKNEGRITCPRSGAVFTMDQLQKAFVF